MLACEIIRGQHIDQLLRVNDSLLSQLPNVSAQFFKIALEARTLLAGSLVLGAQIESRLDQFLDVVEHDVDWIGIGMTHCLFFLRGLSRFGFEHPLGIHKRA